MSASVLAILRPFGSLLRVRDVDIFDGVFKMHSKLTVLLLLAFSALVSANECFGKPMDCVGDRTGDRKAFYDNLCWINGTFTVAPVALGRSAAPRIGVHHVAPGVHGGGSGGGGIGGGGGRTYHFYYQWVNVVLFAQAVICFVPAYMWKVWEHGHMRALCRGLGEFVGSHFDYT